MTILIQGAMDEEVNLLIEHFCPHNKKTIGGYDFYVYNTENHKIIISQTKEGIINTSIATTIGILEFSPDVVINQGCAGAHTKKLSQGDIVIGEKAVYINDFKSVHKNKNKGSNSLDWIPNAKRSYKIYSTLELVNLAQEIPFDGKVVSGILGSGDLVSREYDRIMYLRALFHEDTEDMESLAAMKVCDSFNVKHVALRIISNNELLGQNIDKSVCTNLQQFVIKIVNKLLQEN